MLTIMILIGVCFLYLMTGLLRETSMLAILQERVEEHYPVAWDGTGKR